jgi:hypothetical protein
VKAGNQHGRVVSSGKHEISAETSDLRFGPLSKSLALIELQKVSLFYLSAVSLLWSCYMYLSVFYPCPERSFRLNPLKGIESRLPDEARVAVLFRIELKWGSANGESVMGRFPALASARRFDHRSK